MIVHRVVPAGFRVLIEHDFGDLEKIVQALDGTELSYDFKNTEKQKAVEYLVGEFYAQLDKLIRDVKGGNA